MSERRRMESLRDKRDRLVASFATTALLLTGCTAPTQAAPQYKINRIIEASDDGLYIAPFLIPEGDSAYALRPYVEIDGSFECDPRTERRDDVQGKFYALAEDGALMAVSPPEEGIVTTVPNEILPSAADCVVFDSDVDKYDPETGLPIGAFFADKGKTVEWIDLGIYRKNDNGGRFTREHHEEALRHYS